jgi:hypothetical protein
LKTRIIFISTVFALALCFNVNHTNGQVPVYQLFLENFEPNGNFATANEVTFDICIRRFDANEIEYAGGQYVINFNTMVANGGTLSFSFAGPDTSDLPPDLRPVNPEIIHGSTISQLVLSSNELPAPGSGYVLPIFERVKIIKMKLSTTAPVFYMIGGPLGGTATIYLEPEWRNFPEVLHTSIYAYDENGFDIDITYPPYHEVFDMGLFVYPVELTNFNSSVSSNNVTLKWSTVNETNNSGFDIERAIDNGQLINDSWSRIGNVNGNGTVNEPTDYSFTDRNLPSGKYRYRLKQIDYNGNFEYFYLNNDVVIGNPEKFELSQNYPNPFNPTTNIEFGITESGFVSLQVFDASGKEVAMLVNEIKPAGYYEITFNAIGLSSGIYFYTLRTGNFTSTKRMVLLR